MKNHLYKAALAAALGLVGATAAHAQIANNDLVLGFTSQASGVSDDYIIDLGQIPTSAGVINSTYSASTFGSVFGSALANNQLNVGVIGGSLAHDAITSELDTSGTPSATTPGSVTPPSASQSTIGGGAGEALSLTLGTPAQTAVGSFFQNVAENPTTAGGQVNSFAGYLGNPLSTITGSSIVLDLYENTDSGRTGVTGWVYEGFVDLKFSGDSLTALYDETSVTSVPEPATYGILGGIGVLLLGLRRQLFGKLA